MRRQSKVAWMHSVVNRFLPLSVLLAACSGASTPTSLVVVPTDSPQRATQIAADTLLTEGQSGYDLRCAHCHGYDGNGQIASSIDNTRSLGMLPVPAHNATGHTWQHPDQLLLQVIRQGIQNPLDHYPMPAFGDVLTDGESNQILAYIRLWWTDEQRAYQIEVTRRRAEIDREFDLATEPVNP